MKNSKNQTIPRINKDASTLISSKGIFYYIYTEDETSIYGLVDNRKGKNKIFEFDTLKKLEKKVEELLK